MAATLEDVRLALEKLNGDVVAAIKQPPVLSTQQGKPLLSPAFAGQEQSQTAKSPLLGSAFTNPQNFQGLKGLRGILSGNVPTMKPVTPPGSTPTNAGAMIVNAGTVILQGGMGGKGPAQTMQGGLVLRSLLKGGTPNLAALGGGAAGMLGGGGAAATSVAGGAGVSALLGSVIGGLMAVGTAALKATFSISDMAKSALDASFALKDVSPHIAAIAASAEVAETLRGVKTGVATADSTRALNESYQQLQDTLAPLKNLATNVVNGLKTAATNVANFLLTPFSVAAEKLDGIRKDTTDIKNGMKDKSEPQTVGQWMIDVAQGVKDARARGDEWFRRPPMAPD